MAKIALAHLTEILRARFDLPTGFRERQLRQPFPSGIATIDGLLNGGFPPAALSEISGGASSNRTALVVSVIARV